MAAKKVTKPVELEVVSQEVENTPVEELVNEQVETKTESIKDVTFTPEQMEVIQKLIQSNKGNVNEPLSVYNKRDKTKIETVNVSRFDGKYVIGFKNLQNDPYDKTPRYFQEKLDIKRKLPDQPFVTLILSDGKETEEKEVSLIDYMNYRKKIPMKVVHIEKKEIIEDKGILGRNAEMGQAIDEYGNPERGTAVKAEFKRVEMVFYVDIPGFSKPVEMIDAFLA